MVPGDQIDCKQAEDDRVKSDDELGRERVNAGGVPARTSRAVTRAATRQHPPRLMGHWPQRIVWAGATDLEAGLVVLDKGLVRV